MRKEDDIMDIYAYAESINWNADYYDMYSGLIYGIQEAGRARKFFGIEMEIPVYENGVKIGYAKRSGEE